VDLEIYTALLTPIFEGKIDYVSLKNVLKRQSRSKVRGVVALGTTAEATLLSDYQKRKILQVVGDNVGDKTLVVGVGTPSTKTTVKNAVVADKMGASALLVTTPYFSKYTKDGLIAHFRAISEATSLPLWVYDVPQRSGIELTTELAETLFEMTNVVAVKEAANDKRKVKRLAKTVPNVYGGCDELAKFYTKTNVRGIVSVTSNLCPQVAANLSDKENMRLFCNLSRLLKCEVSPVAAKYVAAKTGLIKSAEAMLPLGALKDGKREDLNEFLQKYGGKLL